MALEQVEVPGQAVSPPAAICRSMTESTLHSSLEDTLLAICEKQKRLEEQLEIGHSAILGYLKSFNLQQLQAVESPRWCSSGLPKPKKSGFVLKGQQKRHMSSPAVVTEGLQRLEVRQDPEPWGVIREPQQLPPTQGESCSEADTAQKSPRKGRVSQVVPSAFVPRISIGSSEPLTCRQPRNEECVTPRSDNFMNSELEERAEGWEKDPIDKGVRFPSLVDNSSDDGGTSVQDPHVRTHKGLPQRLSMNTSHSTQAIQMYKVSAQATKELKDEEILTGSGISSMVAQLESMRQQHRQKTKAHSLSFQSEDSEKFSSRVVRHHLFNKSCTVIILVNSICIGVSTDYEVSHDDRSEPTIQILFHMFNAFFIVELLLRWHSEGFLAFMAFSEDRAWNRFDTLLVAQSIVHMAASEMVGSVARTLKVFKMVRVLRLVRMFRFFTELTALAHMIARSVQTLLWAVVLLMIISYCFAIWFTTEAFAYKQAHPNDDMEVLTRQFGTIWRTCYYLTLSSIGGISWIEVSDTLLMVGPFTAFSFFFYIAFTILAVLNIITGVFVDNALETGKNERSLTMRKQRDQSEKYLKELKDFFEDMDADDSGSISYLEMFDAMASTNGRQCFDALGVEQEDLMQLFTILDSDDSGDIGIDEFLSGCMKLRGEARSIDLQHLLFMCRNIGRRIDTIEDGLNRVAFSTQTAYPSTGSASIP